MRQSNRPDLIGTRIDHVEQHAATLALRRINVRRWGVRWQNIATFHNVAAVRSYDERTNSSAPLTAGGSIVRWHRGENDVAFSTQVYVGPAETIDIDVRVVCEHVSINVRPDTGATIRGWVGW